MTTSLRHFAHLTFPYKLAIVRSLWK